MKNYRALLCALCMLVYAPGAQAAEKIGKIETKDLSVLLVEAGRAVSIALNPKGDKLRNGIVPEVFTVEGPSRVVVDIPMSGGLSKTKRLALNHPLLSTMRIGSHPNKTRLVIEMKKDFSPSYRITPVKGLGAVLIHFSLPDNVTAAEVSAQQPTRVSEAENRGASEFDTVPLLPVPQPKLTKVVRGESVQMRAQPLPSQNPYAGARFQSGVFVTENGIITHRGKKDPAPKSAPGSEIAGVEYMKFVNSKLSGLDSLAIRVNKVHGISLKPVGEHAYQLTLKNTRLKDDISLSPGIGFKKVAPHQQGSSLVVDIEVKDGVQLAADMNDGLLLLRATSSSA